ncbi:unnamed protein product [Cuscuta europaea]|uniref:Uncharacterized protein n=1 Tax=Cuscuta europaea TaxID=41803 RepID=A0A9P0Z2X7_CUSEU|nr:unnamed protein product [Cuscuta europaea]
MARVNMKSVHRNTRSATTTQNENPQTENQDEVIRTGQREEPILFQEYHKPETSKPETSKKRKILSKRKREVPEESSDENEEGERSNRSSFINLRTRVRPAHFLKLIKQLDDNNKAALQRIGFGGLLHLNFDRFYDDFVQFLLENFRPILGQLQLTNGELLDIEDQDVRAVFGLPMGTIDVQEANGKNESEEYNELLKQWRAEWGIVKGSPETTKMIQIC